MAIDPHPETQLRPEGVQPSRDPVNAEALLVPVVGGREEGAASTVRVELRYCTGRGLVGEGRGGPVLFRDDDPVGFPVPAMRRTTSASGSYISGLVWSQVKETIQNPELIVAGIEALDTQGEDGLGKRIARAERDLQKVQIEEERAIRLYVSGKIKEDQLDQQRKFILERLETAREKLDDLRARESMASEKRGLMENLVQWAGKFGKGLDDLPDEKRRDVLRLLVDQVLVDRDNNISITLGIPTEDVRQEAHRLRVPDLEPGQEWAGGYGSRHGDPKQNRV